MKQNSNKNIYMPASCLSNIKVTKIYFFKIKLFFISFALKKSFTKIALILILYLVLKSLR